MKNKIHIYLKITVNGKEPNSALQNILKKQYAPPPAGKMKDTTEETRTINSCLDYFRHKDYETKKTLLKHEGIVNKAKRDFLSEKQI